MDGTLSVGTVPYRHLDQLHVPYLFLNELWLAVMFPEQEKLTCAAA